MANLVRQFLSKTELQQVADAIAAAERQTSGEIRVSIRHKRSRKEKGMNVEQLARREFVHLGMAKTERRTGILIFVLLDAREFFILADEHINQKVAPDSWQNVAAAMANNFAKKEFLHGLTAAVGAVGKHLAEHFPAGKGDKNELSNDVVVS